MTVSFQKEDISKGESMKQGESNNVKAADFFMGMLEETGSTDLEIHAKHFVSKKDEIKDFVDKGGLSEQHPDAVAKISSSAQTFFSESKLRDGEALTKMESLLFVINTMATNSLVIMIDDLFEIHFKVSIIAVNKLLQNEH